MAIQIIKYFSRIYYKIKDYVPDNAICGRCNNLLLFVSLPSGLVNIMCGFGLQQQQFKDVATKVN
jgi:hypothetical protein